jgi:hypothetical protein
MALSLFHRGRFDLLVLGAGRGGTSLVGSLLDSHPQLTVALEEGAREYLLGTRPESRGDKERRLKNFQKACRKAARQAPTRHWGNKVTTEQLDQLYPADWGTLWSPGSPLLAEQPFSSFHAEVGRALLLPLRVVYVSRDGRSCIYSKQQRSPTSYQQALYRWKAAFPWWHWLHEAHPRWHWLRYEDLLREPEESLQSLCDFLGLPYHPAMLKGAGSNRIHEDYRQPRLDPTKAQIPTEAEAFQSDIREELRMWGYEGKE